MKTKLNEYLSLRVSKDNNHRITSEKHLANEAIFVNWKGFLLAFSSLWYLTKDTNLRGRICILLGNTALTIILKKN